MKSTLMIKLVKNDFFIYCKETRIESNRSFYGCFTLGPFDAGQSITIANALRRTLLSELKGLAITSAEIEGAFHEYSTLPGVRDSILDILLNLKDIVLKSVNYGNKKKGTSYAATFKNQQIGYLKTRGPGIVTASELKLPPGIQCVDPDQYIATLSEEGILNMKIHINEGKNYVIQSAYLDQNLLKKEPQEEAKQPLSLDSRSERGRNEQNFLLANDVPNNLTPIRHHIRHHIRQTLSNWNRLAPKKVALLGAASHTKVQSRVLLNSPLEASFVKNAGLLFPSDLGFDFVKQRPLPSSPSDSDLAFEALRLPASYGQQEANVARSGSFILMKKRAGGLAAFVLQSKNPNQKGRAARSEVASRLRVARSFLRSPKGKAAHFVRTSQRRLKKLDSFDFKEKNFFNPFQGLKKALLKKKVLLPAAFEASRGKEGETLNKCSPLNIESKKEPFLKESRGNWGIGVLIPSDQSWKEPLIILKNFMQQSDRDFNITKNGLVENMKRKRLWLHKIKTPFLLNLLLALRFKNLQFLKRSGPFGTSRVARGEVATRFLRIAKSERGAFEPSLPSDSDLFDFLPSVKNKAESEDKVKTQIRIRRGEQRKASLRIKKLPPSAVSMFASFRPQAKEGSHLGSDLGKKRPDSGKAEVDSQSKYVPLFPNKKRGAPPFYPKGPFVEGGLGASKALPLAIDAVFMPVNKVNYIIETNEQSVMLTQVSNISSAPFLIPPWYMNLTATSHAVVNRTTISFSPFCRLLYPKSESEGEDSKAVEKQRRFPLVKKAHKKSLKKRQSFVLWTKQRLPASRFFIVKKPKSEGSCSFRAILASRYAKSRRGRFAAFVLFFSFGRKQIRIRRQSKNPNQNQNQKGRAAPRSFIHQNEVAASRFALPFGFLLCKTKAARPNQKGPRSLLHQDEVASSERGSNLRFDILKKTPIQIERSYVARSECNSRPLLRNLRDSQKSIRLTAKRTVGFFFKSAAAHNLMSAASSFGRSSASLSKETAPSDSDSDSGKKKQHPKKEGPLLVSQSSPRFSSPSVSRSEKRLSVGSEAPKEKALCLLRSSLLGGSLGEGQKRLMPFGRHSPPPGLLRCRARSRVASPMRLKDHQTKTSLKNNIILEIWTNGSIHPRQALYESCKNLLSLFSKLEKATPLAFPPNQCG